MKKTREVMSDPNAVYIGRTNNSEFHYGNPFTFIPSVQGIRVRSRGESIGRYQSWLAGITDVEVVPRRREWIRRNLPTLNDKIVVCWCAPALCHGNALADMLDHKLLSIAIVGPELGVSESTDMLTHGGALIEKYKSLGYKIKLVGVGDSHGRIAASLFNNGLVSQLDLQIPSNGNGLDDNEVKLAVAGGASILGSCNALNADVVCTMSVGELSDNVSDLVQSYDNLMHGLKSIYNCISFNAETEHFVWRESKKPVDEQREMVFGLF